MRASWEGWVVEKARLERVDEIVAPLRRTGESTKDIFVGLAR